MAEKEPIESKEPTEEEKYLTDLADSLEVNPPEDRKGGHDALLLDIAVLAREAVDYEFHDFKNKKYPAPKMALAERFNELRQNTINGKYDN